MNHLELARRNGRDCGLNLAEYSHEADYVAKVAHFQASDFPEGLYPSVSYVYSDEQLADFDRMRAEYVEAFVAEAVKHGAPSDDEATSATEISTAAECAAVRRDAA